MATPAMVAATPNLTTTSNMPVNTERSAHCAMCLDLGRPCTLFALPAPIGSPPYSDWSDFHVEQGWDGERQKERERKEKEWKEKKLNIKP